MPAPSRLLIHAIREVTIVNFGDRHIRDTDQIQAIGEELYQLVDQKNCKKIILDFTKVNLLSSSALGVLLTLKKKADGIKGRFVICGLRTDLREVFKIARLDKQFEFTENEEEALASFGVTTAG